VPRRDGSPWGPPGPFLLGPAIFCEDLGLWAPKPLLGPRPRERPSSFPGGDCRGGTPLGSFSPAGGPFFWAPLYNTPPPKRGGFPPLFPGGQFSNRFWGLENVSLLGVWGKIIFSPDWVLKGGFKGL